MDTKQLQKLNLDHPPETEPADQRRQTKRWGVLVLAIVAVGIATLLWSMRAESHADDSPPTQAPASVEAPAAKLVASGTFTAAGYLEPIPPYPVTVSALVAGRVDEFSVLEGTRVEAGEVLARLNSALQEKRFAELEAALGVNAAELIRAEQALGRIKKLAAIGSAPAKELERAKADAAIAKAEQARLQAVVDRAKWQLDHAAVRAPVDGVVFERLAQVGEFVSPEASDGKNAAIATLYDPSKIQLWADVNQRDAHRVKVGQRAEISLDADPGKLYAARVIRIQPRASLQKNTVQVKVAIENPSPMLRPDMSAKVTFFPADSLQANLNEE